MESKNDIPTKEDKDFIVDDGYNHDEDPTYEPKDSSSSDDDKYVVTGKEFKKLSKKAKKLGAESLDYSTRKNNKYVATLSSGKKIHFGSSQYPDLLIHKDKERKVYQMIFMSQKCIPRAATLGKQVMSGHAQYVIQPCHAGLT